MNRFFKTAILSAAVAATTLATLPAANAGDRYCVSRRLLLLDQGAHFDCLGGWWPRNGLGSSC